MNWFVYHVASGQSLYSGAALVLIAMALGVSQRHVVRRAAPFLFLVGLAGIVVSATPLPLWFYATLGILSCIWFALRESTARRHLRVLNSAALALMLVAVTMYEVTYYPMPRIVGNQVNHLTVFGDSVSAGMGEGEAETWPKIVARTHSIEVRDYAQMGATVSSCLKKAQTADVPEGIVLIEIGGNDLMGTTSAADFERDLDALLALLKRPGRKLVMFELPLPPFFNAYGHAQRTLAKRHGVVLIPKRVLMRVFATSDATLDSIHLSQKGHQMLADVVGDWFTSW